MLFDLFIIYTSLKIRLLIYIDTYTQKPQPMLYFLRKAFSFNKAKKRPLSPYQFIPNLLKLEDRITPATYTVTNNNDSGAGSLRQAIINANLTLANDSIVFSVTGTSYG